MAAEDLVREAQDRSTDASRLAELAQLEPATWPALAAHPNAYDGLLDWLAEHGDDTVRAAISARGAVPPPPPPPAVAAPPPPPAPPAPAPSVAPAPAATPPPVQSPILPTRPVTPGAPPSGPPTGPPSGAPTRPLPGLPPSGPPSAPPSGTSGRGPVLWVVVGVVVLLVLGVGGFFGVQALTGDDDDKGSASAEEGASSSAPASPSASESASTDDGEGEDEGEDSGEAGSDLCVTLKEQQESSLDLMPSTGSDPDFKKLEEQITAYAESYEELAASGPEELRGDLQTIADYYRSLEGVSDGTGGPSDFSSQLVPFTEASQSVSEYYFTNCLG